MGVHDVEKYPAVKALLGIPEDEPIFILRAQDKIAHSTIMTYQHTAVSRGCDEEFAGGLDQVLENFETWQDSHPDVVKLPD